MIQTRLFLILVKSGDWGRRIAGSGRIRAFFLAFICTLGSLASIQYESWSHRERGNTHIPECALLDPAVDELPWQRRAIVAQKKKRKGRAETNKKFSGVPPTRACTQAQQACMQPVGLVSVWKPHTDVRADRSGFP